MSIKTRCFIDQERQCPDPACWGWSDEEGGCLLLLALKRWLEPKRTVKFPATAPPPEVRP